jgi:hypothetical protein
MTYEHDAKKDQVRLEMTTGEYEQLLLVLGMAIGATETAELRRTLFRFVNELNRTNPNVKPYETGGVPVMASQPIEDRLMKEGKIARLQEGRTRMVIAENGRRAKHDDIRQARIKAGQPKFFKVFDVPADASVSSFGAIVYPASTDISSRRCGTPGEGAHDS